MAAIFRFYNYYKKPNSTSDPLRESISPELNLTSGILKDETSINNPTYIMAAPPQSSETTAKLKNCNYAYSPTFDRFYFVTDIVYKNARYEISMKTDVLATYRAQIGAANEYILRATSAFDTRIPDYAAPLFSETVVDYKSKATASSFNWTGNLTGGTYVVGVINSSTQNVGAVSYYVFTPSQFKELCNSMLSDPNYLDIASEELSEGLQKALFNPWQYITSVMWFPFSVRTRTGDPYNDIKFGWWEMDCTCNAIHPDGFSAASIEFEILKHPQKTTHGQYTLSEPFSEYTCFIPGFGEFNIPAKLLVDANRLICTIRVDSVTGIGTLKIHTDTNVTDLCDRQAQIGVPIQIGFSSYDSGAGVQGMANTIGLASGYALLNTFGLIDPQTRNAISGIAQSYTNFSTSGSNGNVTVYNNPPYLRAVFTEQADIPYTDLGRPLHQTKRIGDLTGFVQCLHGDISTTADYNEKQEIKAFLEGGFFYE